MLKSYLAESARADCCFSLVRSFVVGLFCLFVLMFGRVVISCCVGQVSKDVALDIAEQTKDYAAAWIDALHTLLTQVSLLLSVVACLLVP